MGADIDLNCAYRRSEDVVAREIEGEFLLVPIASGIGDMEDALYTLNETGREIWNRLESDKPVCRLVDELCREFDAQRAVIEKDVCGLLKELVRLHMVEACG
jgi:hypothetical protein